MPKYTTAYRFVLDDGDSIVGIDVSSGTTVDVPVHAFAEHLSEKVATADSIWMAAHRPGDEESGVRHYFVVPTKRIVYVEVAVEELPSENEVLATSTPAD